VPILLTGFSIAVSFSAGIWNIGAQGQLYLAAFMVAIVGVSVGGLASFIFLILGLSISVVVGAIWAYIPAYFRTKYNSNEVVMTIMMNSVALYLTSYLTNGPFRTTHGSLGATDKINVNMRFPHFVPYSHLNYSIFLVIAVSALIIYLMKFSKWGYEWKMNRLNTRFAIYGGINVRRSMIIAMIISGALAGLTGGLLVMGDYYRFLIGISPGYSWTGMIIAMMVNYDPVGVVIMSIIYAIMSSGALQMELIYNIPQELVQIIFVITVLLVTAGYSVSNKIANKLYEEG
jgi:simple sugar transport system permease protein